MQRSEFVRLCAIMGIGLPFLKGCVASSGAARLKSSEKVIVIGAGAAGLSAAYLLKQQGFEAEILEASSVYGGRMKRTTSFADFPIPTGAEWLHDKRAILDKIVNDKSVEVKTVTKGYNPEVDYALVDGKKDSLKTLGFTIDLKFINATWFDFYEDYIVPGIKDQIRFNEVVESIDYSTDKIQIRTKDAQYTADRVILTVPLGMLQNNTIAFTPALPEQKAMAIEKVKVWGGCKAFIAFSEKFYPAAVGFNSIPEDQGHKLFYDAAYGQETTQNILGVFAVGPVSKRYTDRNDDDLIRFILTELDEIFDGKASPRYQKHIFQNWTQAPFAQGAYVHYFENWKNIRTLGQPVANKLFFAGDAYTDGSPWSSVPAAAASAKKAVEELVR